jgi:hypothetical protein
MNSALTLSVLISLILTLAPSSSNADAAKKAQQLTAVEQAKIEALLRELQSSQ